MPKLLGYCVAFCWLLFDVSASFMERNNEDVQEVCQLETLKGRCRWNSEVIVMTSARWGRMKTGRCLVIHPNLMAANGHDPLFIGCSADVLEVLDRKCSGRSECDVKIPDPDLDMVKPCYQDQTRFLEASYTCVRVVQESRTCKIQAAVDEQYISSPISSSDSSSSSSSSSCGSVSHPWRLEAAAGQRINISLIDFGASTAERNAASRDFGMDSDVTSNCRQYGYVVEKLNKKNVSLCAEGGAEQRERAVYTSETNNVNIVLKAGHGENGKYNFLVKIQAIGCTNIVPPDNAWLRRSDNDIIIGCYSSHDSWRLKCDGHDWKGSVGTCPELYTGPVVEEPKVDAHDKNSNYDSKLVLGIVVAIGAAALIVCLTVVCIGCMCLRRYKLPSAKKSSAGSLLNGSIDNNETTACSQRLFVNREPAAAATQPFNHTLNYGNTQQQQLQHGQTQHPMSTAQYFVLDNEQQHNQA